MKRTFDSRARCGKRRGSIGAGVCAWVIARGFFAFFAPLRHNLVSRMSDST